MRRGGIAKSQPRIGDVPSNAKRWRRGERWRPPKKKGVGLRRRTAADCARGEAYVGYVAVKVVARERARLDAELKVLGELRRRIQEKNGDMISCRGRSVRRGESKMGDWGARFAETGSCAGLPRWSDNRIKAKCAPR